MNSILHDFVNIISPPVEDAKQMEEVYCGLEKLFSHVLPEGIVFPVCGNKTTVNNRLDFIENNIKNNRGVALGDSSMNIYFSFKNSEFPLGETETNYSQILLGVKRDNLLFTTQNWLALISFICEKVRAYWGLFSPGDDYYQMMNILQRTRFLQNEDREDWNKDTVEQIRNILTQYREFNQLPNLDLAGHAYKVNDVRIVPEIGWVNYWSSGICKYNGITNIPSINGCDIEGVKTDSAACIWSLTYVSGLYIWLTPTYADWTLSSNKELQPRKTS